MKLASPLDFQLNPANNVVVQPLTADPGTPTEGRLYYNSSSKRLLVGDGSTYALKATDSDRLNGQLATFYLARANHTGTQLAATISDLATTVQGYRLDQFAAPTAPVSFGNQRQTNVADPTAAQDGATKNYVDTVVQSAAAGIDSKPSVRAVATSSVTLSGTQTIDGVALAVGDRVLLTAQTTASQNGPYVVASGAWPRAPDADQTGEITPGAFWYVEEGTTYGASQWRASNTGTITLGTTAITIVQFGAAVNYTASFGVQKVGNDFRAQTLAGGGVAAVAGGLQIDTTVVARRAAFTVGNGSATSIALAHNLGTQDVNVAVRLAATNEMVLVDWVATDTNTVTLSFSVAPAANAIKAVVVG